MSKNTKSRTGELQRYWHMVSGEMMVPAPVADGIIHELEAQLAAVTRERDEASAQVAAAVLETSDAINARVGRLREECNAWRQAWDGRDDSEDGYRDPFHGHEVSATWDEGGDECTSCRRFLYVEVVRAAVDAANDLDAHASGEGA